MKLPEKQQGQLAIADTMSATLMALPPEEVFHRAEGKDPVIQQNLVAALGELAAKDPAKREAFLQTLEGFTGDERYFGTRILLRTWGGADPAAVLENWESFEHEDRPGDRPLREEVIARWANRDPAQALGWMDGHPDQVELPQQIDAFRRWAGKDRAAADRWLEGRAAPGAIASGLVKQMHARCQGRAAKGG